MWENKTKIVKFLLVFIILIFFSWLIILESPKKYSFAQETTDQITNSTLEEEIPLGEEEIVDEKELIEGENVEPIEEEEGTEEDSLIEEIVQPTPLYYFQPKERKLNKEIKIAKEASYFCVAKTFQIDISNNLNRNIVEIELGGEKPKSPLLEIGNLPLGIDIVFLNTSDYEWRPKENENTAILQIINQFGSQKGNFSIPIIYTDNESGNSVICQINIINL